MICNNIENADRIHSARSINSTQKHGAQPHKKYSVLKILTRADGTPQVKAYLLPYFIVLTVLYNTNYNLSTPVHTFYFTINGTIHYFSVLCISKII